MRAWRFSYNARIVEVPNRLSPKATAIIVCIRGVDDGQGWKSPEPAGTRVSLHAVQERALRSNT